MNFGRVDLHLHIDGSLYLPWAYEVAKRTNVVPADWTFEQYYNRMHKKDFKSMEEAIANFQFPISVMQSKEDLMDAVYYLVRTLSQQDMYYAEVRYAPVEHTRTGMSQKEVTAAVIEGIKKAKIDFPNVEVRLINCMMHKGDSPLFNMEANMETVEATREYLGDILVGLDLAGYENTGDFALYKPLFDKAKEYGIPYTIHAGEMGDGSHVHTAIEMGAKRIGHGINIVQKPEWLQEVVDCQIPLEVCVTSNAGGHAYGDHPIRQLLKAGVKVTLNTDNMMYSKTTLNNEYALVAALGVDEDTLFKCALNSIEAAFCDEATKEKVRARLYKLRDQKQD